MNSKYGKAYNVKIYKKPEIKYYEWNNEKNIKKRYFIYYYLSEEKLKFKKGDYLIVDISGHGHIVVLHITNFKSRYPVRVWSRNSKYVIPVSRNYIYNCSILTLIKSYIRCYNKEHRFQYYGLQYFSLCQNQIMPKVLNVISDAKSSDVKLLYKIYLEEYKETTNK